MNFLTNHNLVLVKPQFNGKPPRLEQYVATMENKDPIPVGLGKTLAEWDGDAYSLMAVPEYVPLPFTSPRHCFHLFDPDEQVEFSDIVDTGALSRIDYKRYILLPKNKGQMVFIPPCLNGVPAFWEDRTVKTTIPNGFEEVHTWMTAVQGRKRRIHIHLTSPYTYLLDPEDIVKAQQLAERKGWKHIVIRKRWDHLDMVNLAQFRNGIKKGVWLHSLPHEGK